MRMLTVDRLEKGMVVARDIHIPGVYTHAFIPEGYKLTDEAITRIREHNIQGVFILEDADKKAPILPAAPPKKTYTIPTTATKPRPVLSAQLQARAIDSLQTFYDLASMTQAEIRAASPRVVKQVGKVVNQLIDAILTHHGSLVNISDLKSYDEYTYHHSLSVSVLSIAIAQQLKMDKDQLYQVGMSAMMHDIGKIAMPIDIIQKTTALTDQEYSLIKGHSLASYDYLRQHNMGDEEIRRAILFHHEKMDGAGYPMGIKGEAIPIISRIIAVADVYDALTSKRPYREPMQPAEAIEYIMGGVGSAFDYEIVIALVKKLELYPVGSLVELSNSQMAIVVDNENSMRPVVSLVDGGEILDLFNDRECLSIVINRVMQNA